MKEEGGKCEKEKGWERRRRKRKASRGGEKEGGERGRQKRLKDSAFLNFI